MTVNNVITQLRSAEFKGLSTKGFSDTDILSYVNLGLIELYKRFKLKTSESIIDLTNDDTIYELPEDCMYVLEVYDEDGDIYSLNDEDDQLSILTPSWNEIQVPNPEEGASISVIYIANPDWLTDVESTIPIPAQMLEALLHYCGYRGHLAQNGDAQSENNVHYIRFEASCKRLSELGLFAQDDLNYKLTTQDKGYV